MTDTANPEAGATGEGASIDDAAAAIAAKLFPQRETPSEEGEKPQEAENAADGEDTEAEQGEEPAEAEETSTEGEDQPEDEETETEEKAEEPKRYTVTIDGKGHEVTLEELQAGYQRQADYTRKTQEVAEGKKALQAELQGAQETRQLLGQYLPLVEQELAGKLHSQEDLDRLYQTDRAAYVRAFSENQAIEQRRATIRQQVTALHQQQAEQQQKAFAEAVTEGMKRLPEVIPEWKDAKVAKDESKAIAAHLIERGYPAEVVNNLTDPLAVSIARDAWKYRQLMAAKTTVQKRVETAPKVQKPGAAPPSREQREKTKQADLTQRLAKTGRPEDAAALIKARLFGANRNG